MLAFVVDDSRAMRSIMKGLLKDLGYDTLDAVDGKDALRVLASSPKPDVMLIDWNMPEMNGFELMLAVRDNPAYKDVPLLMVTTPSVLAGASTDVGEGDCARALRLVSMAAVIAVIGKTKASLVFMKYAL